MSDSNERLRGSIQTAGLTMTRLAEKLGVDPKTVERWVNKARLPRPTHRRAVAGLLDVDEAYLWPELADSPQVHAASQAELVQFYPCRSAVPANTWTSLIENATQRIDLLAYAALPVVEQANLIQRLVARARAGVAVRVLLGDPSGSALARRDKEEAMGSTIVARVSLVIGYFREIAETPGLEVRLHNTTLYTSIYRADDDALVNHHVFGSPAGQSPVLKIRRIPSGQVFDHYMASLDKVWATGTPLAATYKIRT